MAKPYPGLQLRQAKLAKFPDGTYTIKLQFPFSPDDVANVKTLQGRKWYPDGRFWTAYPTIPNLDAIRSWDFVIDKKLVKFIDGEKKKDSLGFSPCPLYLWVLENQKNKDHAIRNLQKNSQTESQGQEKFSQGTNQSKPSESHRISEEKRRRSPMERKSISSNKKSYAPTGNSRKASGGTGKSKEDTWGEFQRGKRSGITSDSPISEETIVSMWLRDGVSNPDETCTTQISECSECIQSRLWKPRGKNSDRIGWRETPSTKTTKTGSEKNKSFREPWVDCCTLEALQTIKHIPGLKKALYRFQLKGVLHIQQRNGRCLVGDEQGLGKTVQAIAWMHLNPEVRPVVIVVPSSIKLNWAKEIKMWTDIEDIAILSGKTPYDLSFSDVIILNYDIVDAWYKEIQKMQPKVLILDECQLIKNNKAARTKAVKKMAKSIPHAILLSGTPIVNRPIEFFNAIQLVDRTVMPNWPTFTKRYCNPKHNGFGWNYNGASNTEELHEILTNTIMIRRTKKEVLKDLPDKIRSFFPLEMEEALAAEYDQAETNFLAWMTENRGAEAAERASAAATLTEIETLKQIAVRSKLDHAMEWTENFLNSGEKLVVFAIHKFVIDAFMKRFEKLAVKIDGSVSDSNRQLAVDKFQNEAKTRLFVGNIKAAGVGITLTAASNVAFLELPWTPGDMVQAEDRCHRIGQKDSVNIYYLLAEYTIEEKIAALLDEKRKVLDAVLDGKQTEDSGLIMELIESYTE